MFILHSAAFKYLIWRNSERSRNDQFKICNLLEKIPIFTKLTNDQLLQIAEHMEEIVVNEDQKVFEKGEPGNVFYVLIDGKVSMENMGLPDTSYSGTY